MAKQRFRDVKQGKTIKPNEDKEEIEGLVHSNIRDRLKAFITDSFMLVMPLMYIVFYLVFGGREGFDEHKFVGWLYILVPLIIIQIIFLLKSAQTPGMRAYNIILIDLKSEKKPSWNIIIYRQVLTILSLFTFGWMTLFFRKDHRALHELLSGTALIKTNNPVQS